MSVRYGNVSKFYLLINCFLLFCFLFYTSCLPDIRLFSLSRCGSIIVDFGLKFNSITKEQDVIITLRDYVKDGKLGEFSVAAIRGTRTDVEPTGRGATSPPDWSSGVRSHDT